MLFEAEEPKPGAGGKVTLWTNYKQIGEGRLEKTVPVAFSSYAGNDIGRHNTASWSTSPTSTTAPRRAR